MPLQCIQQLICYSIYHYIIFYAICPKVELSTKVQEDILSDLVEIDQLCDSLDVVNILLGFLSTGGGRADSRLEDYLRKLRMETKPISKMVKT